MMSMTLFRPALLSASKVWSVAIMASSSSSSSDTASSGQSRARLQPINGYERTAEKIFKEVLETRQKTATGDWEVPKLFLVERVMDYHKSPHWERDILKLLKLVESKEDRKARIKRPLGSRTIVKNTPFMCKMLWQVKHLVKVSPITFPDGEPTEAITGTHLSRDGVFRIVHSLQVSEQQLLEPARHTKRKFDGKEIAKVLHRQWNNGLS
ncbi:39S ribosomal protein L30, mitochondrial [Dermacentor silvarum]|uniref:39S ribosomal protein L30, mitochondrial n=1 Tax=Dermacentor silvarum TaxID=543639 RepID=UPI00189AC5F1|nr:39S ribosomal protein L30, mitochondrial [Dermacentor silvarum]